MTTLLMHDELREKGSTEARWRVADPAVRDGCIKLFDRQTRKEQHVLFDVINAQVAAEDLILVREAAPKISIATQGDSKLDARIQAATSCVHQIMEIQKKRKCSFAAAYRAATGKDGAAPLIATALPPQSTIYRYAKATRKGLPPFRGDKNKGNRTLRYPTEVTDLIEHAAATYYLEPDSTWTLAKLTKFVNSQVHDRGLWPVGKDISQKFVRNFILQNLSVDPDIDRMDPKLRAAQKSIGAERIVVALPFRRVEQDALHVPITVTVEGQPVTNVYLIHAIDCSTGMPAGWYLMAGSPRESDGLRCVGSTLFSKKEAFKRLGLDREIDIDICGTPEVLVLDNGPEARGERMQRLSRLGITVNYCKSRHPHQKPFIERLNRSLKEALERLSGSTRHEGKDGVRDSVAAGDELMTLQELERWIVKWYYQKWAKTELERHVWSDFHDREKLGHTPEQRLLNVAKRGFPLPLSPAHSTWQMTLYEHDERTLNRKTGIGIGQFSYKGPNLKYLINKYGETKVKILKDPDDYRQIFVFDGEGMPLVPLTERYVTRETPAYSFAYMEAHGPRTSTQEDPVAKKFDQDMHDQAVMATVTRAARKPTRVEKNRSAVRVARANEAVERAARRPLTVESCVNPAKTEAPVDFTFGEIPDLPALSRSTGEVQR